MKRTHTPVAVALALLVSTILVSCGGGGSSGTMSASSAGAPASGMVSAFGSVFVNGTEYSIDGSTNVLDGANDDAPGGDTLTIGGVMVTLNGSTKLRYPGAAGSPTLAGFFANMTVGTTVAAAVGTPGPPQER